MRRKTWTAAILGLALVAALAAAVFGRGTAAAPAAGSCNMMGSMSASGGGCDMMQGDAADSAGTADAGCTMMQGDADDDGGGCPMMQGGATPDTGASTEAGYSCPMHPQVVSDKPGECSLCGMALVQRESGGAGAEAATSPCGDCPTGDPSKCDTCQDAGEATSQPKADGSPTQGSM